MEECSPPCLPGFPVLPTHSRYIWMRLWIWEKPSFLDPRVFLSQPCREKKLCKRQNGVGGRY